MLEILAVGIAVILVAGIVYEQVSQSREKNLPLPGRLVDVGGYRLHATDEGEGGPVVVILHGAGDTAYSWIHVRKQLAGFTRVITYDRPGVGASDDGPVPDAVRSVEELRTLLQRMGAPAPYVLVGHSLGGLIARLYAIRYPHEVAGMVMVDSSHEDLKDDKPFRASVGVITAMMRVFAATSGLGLLRFLGQVFGVMPMYPERPHYAKQLSPAEYRQWAAVVYRNVRRKGGLAELAAAFALMEEADRQRTGGAQFGDMPVAVLTNPGFGASWVAMHKELAGRFTNSTHEVSDQKGHSLHMPRPDLVMNAIHRVSSLATARVEPKP